MEKRQQRRINGRTTKTNSGNTSSLQRASDAIISQAQTILRQQHRAEQHRIHNGTRRLLEVDILPILPSSNGFQHIITMMDVFSRYFFAYPTQDMTARTVARCIIDVMTRHYYLPTVILTDKGSQFRSEVVNRIAQTLDIRIIHASTKHAQTIGILERTHASLKTSLKMSTGEKRSMWHK